MDLKASIKTCTVLNGDEEASTITPNQIAMQNNINNQQYIASDADEELLILVEFDQITHLKNIKMHGLPHSADGNTEMSQPKHVNIFKIKHLNVNFEDIRSMTADKSINCSIKKLEKGQIINLNKNTKNAIKFRNVKCLAIYITSNQNDTEQTYLNGISFYGPEKYKIDKRNKSDKQNRKKLHDLIAAFNQISSNTNNVDSSHLMEPSNVHNTMANTCILEECSYLNAIGDVLKRYDLFISGKQQTNTTDDIKHDDKDNEYQQNVEKHIQFTIEVLMNEGFTMDEAKMALNLSDKNDIEIDGIYDDNYNNIDLLNGFNHLLSEHYHEFEDIYNILIDKVSDNNKTCNLSECLSLRRNHRNRSEISTKGNVLKTLYFNDDGMNMIQQQLLDRIHCHYFHSFDIGFKMTRKEKQNIINNIYPDDDDDDKYDDLVYDTIVSQISRLTKTKTDSYHNVKGLERINAKNNKYITDQKQEQWNDYSFGVRYFYWEHYKHNNQMTDDAYSMKMGDQKQGGRTIKVHEYGVANENNKTLGEWYINCKYINFKEEMLFNKICVIGEYQWTNYVKTANVHIQTDKVREIRCPRKQSAKYYEMQYGQRIKQQHLMAMMIYCNINVLQFKFSETFRKLDVNESDEALKKRHSNYYWFGRLLRECAEGFGMNRPLKIDSIRLYRGVNSHFTFSSMSAFIRGPFSTTTDYSVAVNFCQNTGMILEININSFLWFFKADEGIHAFARITCFEASWISDFSNEQEIFCIGGLHPFRFETVIESPTGKNYNKYIQGLKQMTYNMTNGMDIWDPSIGPASKLDEQCMVFRLLSHEYHLYFPNDPDAHEFVSCPNYFKQILHSHCTAIKLIRFKEIENKVIDYYFKCDNGWIKLDLLTIIFPNVEYINYDAFKKDTKFLTKSSIMESVLSFIHQNHKNDALKLDAIQIRMNANVQDEISEHIEQYKNDLNEYSWKIDLSLMDVVQFVKNHTESIGLDEKILNEDLKKKGRTSSKQLMLLITKKNLDF